MPADALEEPKSVSKIENLPLGMICSLLLQNYECLSSLEQYLQNTASESCP